MSIPGIDPAVPPSGTGCVECEQIGSWWVHLRRCTECGHIGCCDDSINKHATAHWHATQHPIIRSFEPGETWFWDYATGEYYDGPQLVDPQCYPDTQSAPGPASRLPANWRELLRG